MRICIVAEGCYPYVVGGVSSWINSMINVFPKVELVVLAIIADRAQSGRRMFRPFMRRIWMITTGMPKRGAGKSA